MLAALDPLGVIMTVIGLGALIFFHELGHFLACRLTGTRVEAFSIGFGPEIVGWTRGPTRYRVAWIPLGGYVKMAAENPGDINTGAPDEFPNKPFWARLFIMSNGVIFNLILAFVFFVWAFRIGVPFQTTELADVTPGAAAWRAGIRPGDRITHVNGAKVLGFADLQTEIAFSGKGELLRLTVERDGQTLDVEVAPEYSEDAGMPQVGVRPGIELAATGVVAGSAIEKAGGKPGDVVRSVNGRPVTAATDLPILLTRLAGEAPAGTTKMRVTLEVERGEPPNPKRKDQKRGAGKVETISFDLPLGKRPQTGIQPYEGNVVRALASATVAAEIVAVGDVVLKINGSPVADFGVLRERTDADVMVRSVVVRRDDKEIDIPVKRTVSLKEFANGVHGGYDMTVARVAVRPGMAAERAGMQTGDTIESVVGHGVEKWQDVVAEISALRTDAIAIRVKRADGTTAELTVKPSHFPANASTGPLGYEFRPSQSFYKETGVGAAIGLGWRRTTLFVRSVALTIRSLVTRRVSSKHIGGPMMLASVTYRVLDLGWGKYFYILAIISVNLAILNMLPIPVLDGGQIVLLCAEKIRGKPLPEKVVGYYQMVGLALILGLMVLAFRNDITNLF